MAAGQGTIALELLSQLTPDDMQTVYVPVGGGGLVAGTGTHRCTRQHGAQRIHNLLKTVLSRVSRAACLSWHATQTCSHARPQAISILQRCQHTSDRDHKRSGCHLSVHQRAHAGVASVLKAVQPAVEVVGCQPRASHVMQQCVAAGQVVPAPSLPTLSEGTAGGLCVLDREEIW